MLCRFLRDALPGDYTKRMPSDTSDPILFEALIVPHRSLSATGRRWLVVALVGMCAFVGLRFWFLGAWPVIAFSGLEAAAVVFLIHLNHRRARASELVMLSADTLTVVRTSASGEQTRVTLSSAWLNVRLEERDGRVPRLLVGLRDQRIEVGTALGEVAKRDLADALRAALHRARNPVFDEGVRLPLDPSI